MLSAVKKHRPRTANPAPLAAKDSALKPLLVAIGLVIISRIGYRVAGVRFDESSLPWFWQYVDPALLKANLAQSLWYLHSQPPAFNSFLGLIVDLFPGREVIPFTASYLLLGLSFAAVMFLLLKELEVPRTPNVVLTVAYVTSPACILYENWLFYTYPLTILLLLAAVFWQRFARLGRFLDALLMFTCSALLTLTWSLFHLTWLLGLVLALSLCRQRDWRKVVAAAAMPVFVVVLWYGKNLVQVGEFSGSTWFGMNFSKMTNSMLTAPERRTMYEGDIISSVSLVPPFSNPDKYYGTSPKPSQTGIPVLDQEMKPSGIPNFNNRLYVDVSRQYGRDALTILKAHPQAYLRGLAESYLLYFLPASAYLFLDKNVAHIRGLVRFSSIALSGRFIYHYDLGLRQTQPARYYLQGLLNIGWFLLFAYLLVLILGLLSLFRRSLIIPHRPALFFTWYNVAWMTLVANALEVGENNRFRFVTDPLVFVFLAALLVGWLARRRPEKPADEMRSR
jgi:hypothetical protein